MKARSGTAIQASILPPETEVVAAIRSGSITLMRGCDLSRLHLNLLFKSRRHPKSSSLSIIVIAHISLDLSNTWAQATTVSAKKVLAPPAERPGLHFPPPQMTCCIIPGKTFCLLVSHFHSQVDFFFPPLLTRDHLLQDVYVYLSCVAKHNGASKY